MGNPSQMTLYEIKMAANIPYSEIAARTGMKRSNVCRALKTPWRTRLETFLRIARAINADEDAAREEWRESNITHQSKRIARASEA